MKKVVEIFQEKKHTFSFELFPPKTEPGYAKLLETIGKMTELKPDFFSVTYGAGGGNREKTFQIVDHIQKTHGIAGVAHLTCVCNTKDQIKNILREIKDLNIRNILALRGDPPKDNPSWQPGPENFKYSSELCAFTRALYQDYFGVGVAGFPEGHLLCPDREMDAQYLKVKIDSGADYVITQLFFDNKDYFDYIARLGRLGVKARIIPGILTITDYKTTVNFCRSCGAGIPPRVHEIFTPIQDDPNATLKEGIQFAVRQCRDLLDGGAPGIHFYTLNKINPTDVILSEIRR